MNDELPAAAVSRPPCARDLSEEFQSDAWLVQIEKRADKRRRDQVREVLWAVSFSVLLFGVALYCVFRFGL